MSGEHCSALTRQPTLLPEAVRLKNVDDARDQLGKLMERWDYLVPRERHVARKSKMKEPADLLSDLKVAALR